VSLDRAASNRLKALLTFSRANDFEKASFLPVATVAGIPGGKKRVTGTEVTRFGAGKQVSRQWFGQAGQYGRGG
jgi:hypothetical protein